jgi:capsular polysaccharide biosynthesis protein
MSMQTEGRATGNSPGPDLEAEREVDLRGLWTSVKRQWWVVVAGIVAGIVVGALWSLAGGSAWEATARLAPGQAFSPSGSPVFLYLTNPTAINSIATSPATIEQAAVKAGIPASALRGHISTDAVNSEGTTTQRNAVLVLVTVRQNKKKKAEDAANAVARVVAETTTNRYVRQTIQIYKTRIRNFNQRLTTIKERIDAINEALAQPGLSLDERLLLTIQLDQAQATQGQTIDSLTTAQQQMILAQDVSQTTIVQDARATRTSARSRRTSILVGALIGLIGGLIAAIVVDRRAQKPSPA